MTYELIFSEEAIKQLKTLLKDIIVRIINSLERIRIRPHSYVKKLVGSPCFRLRVGDYKIILDIKGSTLLILVLEVGHRKDMYK